MKLENSMVVNITDEELEEYELSKKTAKEMFEELGYKKSKKEKMVEYVYEEKRHFNYVLFHLDFKSCDMCISDLKNTKLLQAINKFYEEQGWK